MATATAYGAGAHAQSHPEYVMGPVRLFTLITIFWGVVGFLAGDFIAWQLAFPAFNLGLEWTSFGRLRPLHTSAVIFAFGGNARHRCTSCSGPAGPACSAVTG
jgi:cytochrome c oxidase cbb3-type subunit I